MQEIEEENIYPIIKRKEEDLRMKMFAIIVREKVIGQINVKMPKRREEDQEVDLIEREEVLQVEDLVVLEKIEKEDLIVAVEVHQAVNLEVILVKANQSNNLILY